MPAAGAADKNVDICLDPRVQGRFSPAQQMKGQKGKEEGAGDCKHMVITAKWLTHDQGQGQAEPRFPLWPNTHLAPPSTT
jgi:hypothetical protein